VSVTKGLFGVIQIKSTNQPIQDAWRLFLTTAFAPEIKAIQQLITTFLHETRIYFFQLSSEQIVLLAPSIFLSSNV
jgi:hypothetical protein